MGILSLPRCQTPLRIDHSSAVSVGVLAAS